MTVRLNAYLGFRDNAREAIEFYHSVFGGELRIHTFAEFQASDDPSEQDKVMHSMLEAGEGLILMAADTPNRMEFTPAAGISLSLGGDEESVLRGYWDRLTEGGTVMVPLAPAAWGDIFGMGRDKFGITWMVNIVKPESSS